MNNANVKIRDLMLIALFTALIIIGGFIKIPLPYVPITLQYIFCMLSGLLLGGFKGSICVLIYIFMGLIGIPVFTAGGGFSYVLYPTFGYLVGFFLGAFITGYNAQKQTNCSFLKLFMGNIVALLVVYICGVSHAYFVKNFYLNQSSTFGYILIYYFLIFLPTDTFFAILAAVIAKKLRPVLYKQGYLNTGKQTAYQKVINKKELTMQDIQSLINMPIKKLTKQADKIRKYFCKDTFDICQIINVKCGRCSEDCKFCTQSSRHNTKIDAHDLLSPQTIADAINACKTERCSLVSSGKSLSDRELDKMGEALKLVKNKKLCVSFGLLNKGQFEKIKNDGALRIHNNLETSKDFFGKICSTHTYDDKIKAVEDAKSVELEVCSGGIIGMGESMSDRIDLALALKRMDVKSVPINILHPIENTPLENAQPLDMDEILRTIAIFRFILPESFIRLAGGRTLLQDSGASCFKAGANAAILGDMLTTQGVTFEKDLLMIKKLGYKINIQ